MSLRRAAIAAIAASLVLLTAAPARADITAFLGVNTTPSSRLVTGAALGASILIVGIEGEYAVTRSDDQAGAPSLKTGMINAFLQTPIPIKGLQFYLTAGGGLYNEALGPSSTTGFGSNVGGGTKIELVSHVKLRIDYRVFNLSGSPMQPTPKRLYAGVSLSL
jgi:hypothetical protein